MGRNSDELVILDCTIRDGSYVVDFKFTKTDTSLLTAQLARLGFKWIEVGHGFGLGAMEAGKGSMPASDVDLIRAAKMASGDARVGTFFIPGIGRMEHLEMAREAGLDFVRVGDNAPDVERAYPFITRARELGLIPCLNMMKSYAVTPKEFALKAKAGVDAGAEIVYCVDSAGSMLPDDIARYYDATRDLVDCKLGFHGHNNLMMAIANCMAAYDHGARFLDATLCGLGRSAGNAPTEILVAVCERLGIATHLDLFAIMDAVEWYMWPLVAQTRPHDMLAVASGYSQFHSSFLRKVAGAAREHGAELRRLVARVALHDPVTVDEEFLQVAAKDLAGSDTGGASDALLTFRVPGFSREQIGTSLDSVRALIEGLSVSCAKRAGTRTVLHLVPSREPSEDLLLPEFVLADCHMVLGRVIYGSLELLRQVMEVARSDVFMFLVSQEEGWASEAVQAAARVAGIDRIVPVRDQELRKLFILEVLDRAAQRHGCDALLVYGADAVILQALATGTAFRSVFLYGVDGAALPPRTRAVVLKSWDDWRDLRLQFNVVLVAANPPEADARVLAQALAPGGRLLSILRLLGGPLRVEVERLVHLDLNVAYCGIVARCLEAERTSCEPS